MSASRESWPPYLSLRTGPRNPPESFTRKPYELLRERLKEAKGIGTPATRADIIRGLKKQSFLMIDGKHIVPTETGLSLFSVLEKADPELVDPGATAQLEYLLDDVVRGKHEMVGAIDAVCDVALRIIGKLTESGRDGGTLPPGGRKGGGSNTYPPTPAMTRYAESLARQKGLHLPTGYDISISICRTFLNEHRAKKADDEERRPAVCARTPNASEARKELDIADNAEVTSIAKLAPMKVKQAPSHARKGSEGVQEISDTPAATRKRRTNKRRGRPSAIGVVQSDSESTTPLRIPYGNKEIAMKLGARYGPSGWYAPSGIDLSVFRERGWS